MPELLYAFACESFQENTNGTHSARNIFDGFVGSPAGIGIPTITFVVRCLVRPADSDGEIVTNLQVVAGDDILFDGEGARHKFPRVDPDSLGFHTSAITIEKLSLPLGNSEAHISINGERLATIILVVQRLQ